MGQKSKSKRAAQCNLVRARRKIEAEKSRKSINCIWKRKFLVKCKMFSNQKARLDSATLEIVVIAEKIRVTSEERDFAIKEFDRIKTIIKVEKENWRREKEEKTAIQKEEILKIQTELETQKRLLLLESMKRIEILKSPISPKCPTPAFTTPPSVPETPKSSRSTPSGTYNENLSRYKKTKITEEIVTKMKDLCGNDHKNFGLLLKDVIKQSSTTCSFRMTLTDEETLLFRSIIHLSDGDLKKMKKFFKNTIGIDVIGSRLAVSNLRRELSVVSDYTFSTEEKTKTLLNEKTTVIKCARAVVSDVEASLRIRLDRLAESNLLVYDNFTQDEITVCLMGDKGSNETKLCLAIGNVKNPSSPNGLLILGVYEGNDSYEELTANFSGIFSQFDKLDEISFTESGTIRRRRIRKHLVGDFKYLSASFGHAGATSSNPCVFCSEAWSNRGKYMMTLEKVNFDSQVLCRTYDSFLVDAQSGSNGVIKGSKPLVRLHPEQITIPTVHLLMGLWSKFGEEYIVGCLNDMDKTGGVTGKTLREQKKELTRLTKEEKLEQSALLAVVTAAEEAMVAATSYNILEQNPKMHLIRPNRLCDAALCITNHMSRNTDLWVQCDDCQKDMHTYCSSIFSPELKSQLSLPKFKFTCDLCKKLSVSDQKVIAWKEKLLLDQEQKKVEDRLKAVQTAKENYENVLKGSTGPNKKAYEQVLISIGCDTRTWYQSMGGNQVRTVLRKEHIDLIMELLPDSPRNRTVKQIYYFFAEIMSMASNKTYSDEEIDEIEKIVKNCLQLMKEAFAKETITPKLHALAFHLIPFLRKFKTWGRLSEQGMEHLHSKFNDLAAQFASVRNPEHRLALIVQELGLRNYLFDKGLLE